MNQTDPLVASAQNGVTFAQGRQMEIKGQSKTERKMGAKLGLFHQKASLSSAGRALSANQLASPLFPALCGQRAPAMPAALRSPGRVPASVTARC